MSRSGSSAAAAAVFLACACSPTLDWREVRPENGGVVALFPCKPERREREVPLGGDKLRMTMHSCAAGGATFALSFADVADPARVGSLLAEWRRSVASNLGAPEETVTPAKVSGMTPQPQAQRVRIQGHLPDGKTVEEHAVYFVRGLRVYQAAVVGDRLSAEALDTFFSGLDLTTREGTFGPPAANR